MTAATILARQAARAAAENTTAINDVNDRILTLLEELVKSIGSLSENLAAVVDLALNREPATVPDTDNEVRTP